MTRHQRRYLHPRTTLQLLATLFLCFEQCGGQAPTPAPSISPAATPAPIVTTLTPTSGSGSTAAPTPGSTATNAPTTAATPTFNPTISPGTDVPTPAPVTAAPTTLAPVTLAPTTKVPTTPAPTTATPVTATPTTPAPTTSPPSSPAPTTLAPTTQAPTVLVVPTTSPTTTTPLPTATPTLRPSTAKPTGQLSARPTFSPTVPRAPTSKPTIGGLRPFSQTVDAVVATFPGVSSLNQTQVSEVLTTTQRWFDASYNVPLGSRTRRFLQMNPALSGVTDMKTTLTFIEGSSTSQATTLTYRQAMTYKAKDPIAPGSLVSMPYDFAPTSNAYLLELRKIDGLKDVQKVPAPYLPGIDPSPTSAPSAAPASSDPPLSAGAIAGIVVGCVIGLPLLGYLGYKGYQGIKNRGSGSPSVGGYVSAGSAPPAQFNVTSSPTGEEVSMIDDKPETQSLDYQDQSVATVDYDYSKAYGGGGDTSVVSSAGGTMGDNTRQTAGDVATSTAAARAALGASFDSEGQYQGEEESNVKEEVIEIDAPAGKLGVVIDTPDDGAPVVHAVKDSSIIADQICVGDKLIAVDDEDVRSMTAIKVSKLISKKSANPSRKLTIVRTSFVDGSDG